MHFSRKCSSPGQMSRRLATPQAGRRLCIFWCGALRSRAYGRWTVQRLIQIKRPPRLRGILRLWTPITGGRDAFERHSDICRSRYVFFRDPKSADRRRDYQARRISRGVDAHRPAPPVDASLRRNPASDHADNAERGAVADPVRDRSRSAGDAGQRDRNIASSNRRDRVGLAVLPSILCGLRMGHHVADARGPRRRRRGHHSGAR